MVNEGMNIGKIREVGGGNLMGGGKEKATSL